MSAITTSLPKDKVMFEAADPTGTNSPIGFANVFSSHIQNQAATANLFIDHSQVV